jgi:hypothetical protein
MEKVDLSLRYLEQKPSMVGNVALGLAILISLANLAIAWSLLPI